MSITGLFRMEKVKVQNPINKFREQKIGSESNNSPFWFWQKQEGKLYKFRERKKRNRISYRTFPHWSQETNFWPFGCVIMWLRNRFLPSISLPHSWHTNTSPTMWVISRWTLSLWTSAKLLPHSSHVCLSIFSCITRIWDRRVTFHKKDRCFMNKDFIRLPTYRIVTFVY